jgi:hypothetical protein
MVHLEFTIPVNANLERVWAYFSRFEVITEWDPNTRGCKVIKKTPQEVGSEYDIITVFNDSTSVVRYVATHYKPMQMISLHGQNDDITAIDEIIFTPVNDRITNVTYIANITLNGFKCCFTPFIRGALRELSDTAKKGMLRRSEELFGKVMM